MVCGWQQTESHQIRESHLWRLWKLRCSFGKSNWSRGRERPPFNESLLREIFKEYHELRPNQPKPAFNMVAYTRPSSLRLYTTEWLSPAYLPLIPVKLWMHLIPQHAVYKEHPCVQRLWMILLWGLCKLTQIDGSKNRETAAQLVTQELNQQKQPYGASPVEFAAKSNEQALRNQEMPTVRSNGTVWFVLWFGIQTGSEFAV